MFISIESTSQYGGVPYHLINIAKGLHHWEIVWLTKPIFPLCILFSMVFPCLTWIMWTILVLIEYFILESVAHKKNEESHHRNMSFIIPPLRRRGEYTVLPLCVCACVYVCVSVCLSVTQISIAFFSATIHRRCLKF